MGPSQTSLHVCIAYIELISSALVNVRHNGPQCRSTVTHPRRYSRTEYCSPIWVRSSYTQLVESQRNNCAPLLSGNGTIRPTQLPWLTVLASIASPALQRKTAPDVFLCTRHWLIRNGQATSTSSTTHLSTKCLDVLFGPTHRSVNHEGWGSGDQSPLEYEAGTLMQIVPQILPRLKISSTGLLVLQCEATARTKIPHGVHQHAILSEKFNFLLG